MPVDVAGAALGAEFGEGFAVLHGIFLENNNKIQTISLVRKRLKLIWNITTRV